MSDTLDDPTHRRASARSFSVAVAVSALVHLLALWQAKPLVLHPSPEADRFGEGRGPLAVRILPPPPVRPPAVRQPPPSRAERPSPRPPRAAAAPPRGTAPPPVIALDRPPAPSRVPPQAPPARAPAGTDLSSYIEARRRAREASSPSLAFPDARPQAQADAEDANARASRLAAANLATGRAQAFGYDPHRGGGIFSIQHVAYDYAEFLFYGWNRDARRNTAQLIEVRRGAHPDIRLAVVRRMIAIIREYEREEFLWESRRLGRYVTLSARPRDNDGLEDFMLAEFFDELRRVR